MGFFRFLAIIPLLIALPSVHATNSMDAEIRQLIAAVGRDGCQLIRNDRQYRAREAREHLRSKWELNEHLVNSTEDFIEKIASRSATTGNVYLIDCEGQPIRPSGDWFQALLAQIRNPQ